MKFLSWRTQAAAAVVALLLGACDSAAPPPSDSSEDGSVAPTSTTVGISVATTESHNFDYRRVIVDYGGLFVRPDVQITRGLLMSADGSTMVVEVAEELTPRGATLGEVEFRTGDLGLTSAEDMIGVTAERGGPVPVLVIATDTDFAMHVLELEAGGRRFAPGRTEFPKLGTTNLWLNRGIESGDFDYEDPESGETLEFVPGDDQVADFVAFAIAAYDASERE